MNFLFVALGGALGAVLRYAISLIPVKSGFPILQEKGNLHLYEKLGYHQTGKIENINERMDIVFYEKG